MEVMGSVFRRMAALAMVGVAVAQTGCGIYTNIPPQAGDHLAQHSPNRSEVQNVMVEALNATLDQRPIRGTFQVILPSTADAMTYATLLPRLGDDAMWSSDGRRGDVPVLEVKQVRVRGTSAAVDIIRPTAAALATTPAPHYPGLTSPTPPRMEELVTVQLRRYLGAGWGATRVYAWNADVDEALRISLAAEPSEIPEYDVMRVEPEPR